MLNIVWILLLLLSFQLMKLFISEYNLDLLIQIVPSNMIFVTLSMKYITVYTIIENVSPQGRFNL